MKRMILVLTTALTFASCQKEELPTPEACNRGIISQLATIDAHQINGNTWYYVYFVDECRNGLIRRRVQKETFDTLEVGQYFEWSGGVNE